MQKKTNNIDSNRDTNKQTNKILIILGLSEKNITTSVFVSCNDAKLKYSVFNLSGGQKKTFEIKH